jgi:hypothetical protein
LAGQVGVESGEGKGSILWFTGRWMGREGGREDFMLSKPRYEVIGEIERYDERNNIQARGQC